MQDVATPPLESALALAQSEGLEPNVVRWIRFAGPRRYHELQALNIRFGNAVRTYFAHAPITHILGLIARAEKEYDCAGTYVIANPIKPAVATRGELAKWRAAQKGESTTDRDIAARMVAVIDIDAVRPSGTSATDLEVEATALVAGKVYETLAAILESDSALAYGHTGNGRMVLIALDALTNDDVTLHTIKAILIALHSLYSTDEAQIDPAVCDAKRLIPAWGSMKKKGAAGIPERPHRRTALLCAEEVTRISTPELRRVLATLRADCTPETQRAIDKEMGVKSASEPRTSPGSESPFTRANAVPVADVVAWLGLDEGDAVRCPGCGECDGTSVVLINNGLKCSHARCSLKGKPGGFRTPVDLVVEAHNVSPKDAVTEMAERFGFEGFTSPKAGPSEPPDGRFDDEPNTEDPKPTPSDSPKVWTAVDVVTQWVAEGPLAHLPTGFPTLDERTGGGPTEGCRVYLLGAPNAWKTALLAQLADVYELQGCLVGFLCVDEEPGDLVTRFMQRRKWRRQQCELRAPEDMPLMLEDAGKMTIRIYTDEFTIEDAAAELAAKAKAEGKRPVLLVDSVQTVRSKRTTDETSPREAVNHVVKAIRTMAIAHRMLVFAACEMNRGAYRNIEAAEQNNDMAAGKESGAIEYAARLMLALRSVPKQKAMVDVRIVKNKLGTEGEPFFIQGEHGRMLLEECAGPPAAEPTESKTAKNIAKLEGQLQSVIQIVLAHPGMGTRGFRAAWRVSGHGGDHSADGAIQYAVSKGLVEDRKDEKGNHHYFIAPTHGGG